MNSLNYLSQNVFEAALDRIRFVYDHCDEVVVTMSGGKDSTVMFELALRVATERARLPLKVFWLDQEAEWLATESYMRSVFRRAQIEPWWFQIPFRLTNSLSFTKNYLQVWDPRFKDVWLRDQDPLSVKVNPMAGCDRFHTLVECCPSHCRVADARNVGVLVGLRADESPRRRMTLMHQESRYAGITWCMKSRIGNTRKFWPIYDWQTQDVWTAIANEKWAYNCIYDYMYQAGIRDMRVSALIHETAWHYIRNLHEFEPQLYDRYLKRLAGVNCFDHFDTGIMPRALPPVFRDWKSYRNYLLKHLVEARHQGIFKDRWKKQEGDKWYRIHVHEVIVNDLDGTINANGRSKLALDKKKADGWFRDRDRRRHQELFNNIQMEAKK
jgi:predicted phosphoadenosine phosphosulfate sulfurtransferase